jgi:hypothetical protein
MTDEQENRLSRAEKVETFLILHKSDIAATPALSSALLPQLTTANGKMNSDDALAVQDNTGYAEQKAEIRTNLENLTDHVGSGVESYADDADDFVLQNSVEFTISQIQGFRDNRLAQYAQFVVDKASDATIKAALIAEHNITQGDIDTLSSSLKSFTEIEAKPQQMRGETVAYGKLVDRDLADIDVILGKIRRKMNTYRYTNRLLFDAFTATDNIDDTGSHKKDDVTVGMGETKSALSFTYDAAASIGIENTGKGPLDFQVYDKGVATGSIITILPGNAVNTKLGDLAPSGDELKVTNKSLTAVGSYIITS